MLSQQALAVADMALDIARLCTGIDDCTVASCTCDLQRCHERLFRLAKTAPHGYSTNLRQARLCASNLTDLGEGAHHGVESDRVWRPAS